MKLDPELTRKCLELAGDRPRDERDILSFTLPLPPSTNHLFATVVRGGKPFRVKAKPYREWISASTNALAHLAGCFVPSPVSVEIHLKGRVNLSRDLGNVEKPVTDLAVGLGFIADDSLKHVRRVCLYAYLDDRPACVAVILRHLKETP